PGRLNARAPCARAGLKPAALAALPHGRLNARAPCARAGLKPAALAATARIPRMPDRGTRDHAIQRPPPVTPRSATPCAPWLLEPDVRVDALPARRTIRAEAD